MLVITDEHPTQIQKTRCSSAHRKDKALQTLIITRSHLGPTQRFFYKLLSKFAARFCSYQSDGGTAQSTELSKCIAPYGDVT